MYFEKGPVDLTGVKQRMLGLKLEKSCLGVGRQLVGPSSSGTRFGNKLWEHSHIHLCHRGLLSCYIQHQSWFQRTVWPTKPNILTGTLKKKFLNLQFTVGLYSLIFAIWGLEINNLPHKIAAEHLLNDICESS